MLETLTLVLLPLLCAPEIEYTRTAAVLSGCGIRAPLACKSLAYNPPELRAGDCLPDRLAGDGFED